MLVMIILNQSHIRISISNMTTCTNLICKYTQFQIYILITWDFVHHEIACSNPKRPKFSNLAHLRFCLIINFRALKLAWFAQVGSDIRLSRKKKKRKEAKKRIYHLEGSFAVVAPKASLVEDLVISCELFYQVNFLIACLTLLGCPSISCHFLL